MLHYFGFTIQLVMLRVFNVKVKNLTFDTSKSITNAWFSMKNYHECMHIFHVETSENFIPFNLIYP